ncbi:MAG: hypothetical protein JO290_11235, partial [Sphingomonadaceae bacterium]|nr:hypothetical protein [Sphingomonadaceae bacterium]MBV9098017.1 hypothetical protein [Frankiaceae bacterium]
ISADLTSVDRNGVVNSAAEIDKANRFVRDRAIIAEKLNRGTNAVGGAAAGAGVSVMDGIISSTNPGGVISGQNAVGVIDHAANSFDKAVDRFGTWIDRTFGSGKSTSAAASAASAGGTADKAQAVADFFVSRGWSRVQATGIAANLLRESSLDPRAIGDHGEAYGLAQHHRDRQAVFAARYGHTMQQGTPTEQLDFINYELTQGSRRAAGIALHGAQTAEEAAAIVSRQFEAPANADAEARARAQLATKLVHVHRFEGLPTGTTVTTKTSGSDGVAIGRALAY